MLFTSFSVSKPKKEGIEIVTDENVCFLLDLEKFSAIYYVLLWIMKALQFWINFFFTPPDVLNY